MTYRAETHAAGTIGKSDAATFTVTCNHLHPTVNRAAACARKDRARIETVAPKMSRSLTFTLTAIGRRSGQRLDVTSA